MYLTGKRLHSDTNEGLRDCIVFADLLQYFLLRPLLSNFVNSGVLNVSVAREATKKSYADDIAMTIVEKHFADVENSSPL